MKEFFEKLLWGSRYMTLMAVWSCIIGMTLLFTLSAIDMGMLLVEFINVYVLGHDVPDFHTIVVSHVITAVDDFLLAYRFLCWT